LSTHKRTKKKALLREKRPRKERDRRAGLPTGWVKNLRFNRIETPHDHIYNNVLATGELGTAETPGMVKCRLLHGNGYSLIVPDQLFVGDECKHWIQPLGFLPNVVAKESNARLECALAIDISFANSVRVVFSVNQLVRGFEGGAQLYKCNILGPPSLASFATGSAEWIDGLPYLRLFHHTTAKAKRQILDAGHFRSGSYSIQGTTKTLTNVSYAYFTPLDTIRYDSDLKKIAMAQGGKLHLLRDGFERPKLLPPNFLAIYKEDILELPVYPCNPSKREATLAVSIDASILAPQHIYRHEGRIGFYEMPHCFIHRVGTEPGRTVAFDAQGRIHRQSGLKAFDYVVVGDCTTLEGLAAPYDEENTRHVMKVQRLADRHSMLSFWFEHANEPLFANLEVAMQEFAKK